MKDKPTKEWWICLCDGAGNVRHVQLHEFFQQNRNVCIDGGTDSLPVGMAGSMEKSMEVGRLVKRAIHAARIGMADQTPEVGGRE